MKKALSTLAAILALAAGAADAALLKLTPENCTAVISVDIRGLLENPEFKKIAAKPGTVQILSEAERLGVRLADIGELAVFNWDDNWYGVFRVENGVRLREELERRCAEQTPTVGRATVAGRPVYTLKQKTKGKNHRRRNKEICLLFVDDGAVLIAKTAELEKFLKTRRADATEIKRLAGNRAEAWAEYRRNSGNTSDGETFDARLKRGKVEIKLAGGNQGDIDICGTADFVDHESAESMGMTLPGVLAFFMGLVLADDPETADKIVRALRTEVDGGILHLYG